MAHAFVGASLILRLVSAPALAGIVSACAVGPAVQSDAGSVIRPAEAVREGTSQPGDALRMAAPSRLIRQDRQIIGEVRTTDWPNSVALGIVASGVRPGRYSLVLRFSGRCYASAQAGASRQVSLVDVPSDGRIFTTVLAMDLRLRPTSSGGGQLTLLDVDGAALEIVDSEGIIAACAVLR